jgi:hypothetical protein
MTTPDVPWPGRDSVLLPTTAFLLSVRDQTLPARRAALDDSVDHYSTARSSDDEAWRDMALLGVVGDALIIEDVAALGSAFERPRFPGRPVYVSLLAYSDRTATNFYGSIKNWPDERLRVLASFNGRDPQTGV